jgi:hypothetical protein
MARDQPFEATMSDLISIALCSIYDATYDRLKRGDKSLVSQEKIVV